jgi:UDP-glucuronate 4-epimerase
MNIFITGIAGFIGYHLAKKLSLNHNVIGLDNFNDYYDVSLKRQRAKDLNLEIIEKDIQDTASLKDILKKNKIDCFIHLAAQAGVRHSLSHPDDYVNSNLLGFVSVLKALKEYPTKFVFASSSSVYGDNKKTPFSETDETNSPVNLYGATKKSNEVLAYSYHSLYKIPMIGLRFFTVYGPFGRPDMAYFLFSNKITQNKPIDLFGYDKMQRDFTYIDDIINGIISSIHLNTTFEIFNLGNNKPEKTTDLIKILEKEFNKEAIINQMPVPQGEILTTYADIDKSKKLLKFDPKTSLKDGIKEFTNWYKDYFNIQQ